MPPRPNLGEASNTMEGHVTEAHHRHYHPQQQQQQHDEEQAEVSPLVGLHGSYQKFMQRHMSMENDGVSQAGSSSKYRYFNYHPKHHKPLFYILIVAFVLAVAALVHVGFEKVQHRPIIIPVEKAQEYLLDIQGKSEEEKGLKIWFRTWGRQDGIPLLFIHGGPGNAIEDYFDNKRFFVDHNNTFFVVEVDQRGTGYSQPSVRDDWKNMKYYQDISIDKMCADFEQVRKFLNIEKWLVWGGSFGSTLGINYGERYPESCLALILRGIYLDTAEEVETVYGRETYADNPKRVNEFDTFFDYVDQYVADNSLEPLDPNDGYRIMKTYNDMIVNGDPYAIWHWFVFENNLMETDPANILDPDKIDEKFYPESLSVAFFETRLWLHGSYEHLSNLMDQDKIDRLEMPLWICQGQHDEVCPSQYARRFANLIEMGGKAVQVTTRFVDGGHEDTDPAIAECLKVSLHEFVNYERRHSGDTLELDMSV